LSRGTKNAIKRYCLRRENTELQKLLPCFSPLDLPPSLVVALFFAT